MISHELKEAILVRSGVVAYRRSRNRRPRIVFWHGVGSQVDPTLCPEIFDVNIFKKQVRYLSRHYDVVSIDEFCHRLNNATFTGREVLLTFDDGYANNLSVVEPILSQYGMPFTIFISTDNISSGEYYPTTVNRLITIAAGLDKLQIPTIGKEYDLQNEEERKSVAREISKIMKSSPLEQVKSIVADLIGNVSPEDWADLKRRFPSLRPMNWDEVRQLSKKENVTIGSHGMWHICCHERQREADIQEQLEKSRQIIEEHLQSPCDYFAYPNGNYTDFSNRCVDSCYKLGFSAETKTRVCLEHKCILPRITGYINLNLFKILLSS